MWRSQKTKGQQACAFQRVPAEHLEDAVLQVLLDTYGDPDQFERALDVAMTQFHDDRPRLQQELAATDTKVRETTAAMDR